MVKDEPDRRLALERFYGKVLARDFRGIYDIMAYYKQLFKSLLSALDGSHAPASPAAQEAGFTGISTINQSKFAHLGNLAAPSADTNEISGHKPAEAASKQQESNGPKQAGPGATDLPSIITNDWPDQNVIDYWRDQFKQAHGDADPFGLS